MICETYEFWREAISSKSWRFLPKSSEKMSFSWWHLWIILIRPRQCRPEGCDACVLGGRRKGRVNTGRAGRSYLEAFNAKGAKNMWYDYMLVVFGSPGLISNIWWVFLLYRHWNSCLTVKRGSRFLIVDFRLAVSGSVNCVWREGWPLHGKGEASPRMKTWWIVSKLPVNLDNDKATRYRLYGISENEMTKWITLRRPCAGFGSRGGWLRGNRDLLHHGHAHALWLSSDRGQRCAWSVAGAALGTSCNSCMKKGISI